MADRAAQLGDRRGEFLALGGDAGDLLLDRLRLHIGAQVHRPHLLALLQQAFEAAAGFLLHLGRKLRRRIGHRGIGAEPFGDAFLHRGPCLLGLCCDCPPPAPHPLAPRPSAASAARAARSASAERMGGAGQAVRRGAMRGLSRFQRVERLGATGRDLPGRRLQDRVLGSRPQSRRSVRSPTLRPASAARCAQSARSAAIADRRERCEPHARGPASRVRPAPSASADRAAVSAVRARLDRPAQRVQVGQRVLRIASVRECSVRVIALDRQTLDLRVDGGEPCSDLRCLGAQVLVRRARALQVLFGARPGGARLLLGRRCRLIGLGGGVARLCGGCGFVAGRGQVAPQH